MTPQDTLALLLDEPIVRIVLVTNDGTDVSVSGLIPESVALNRLHGLRTRNPGTTFCTRSTK